MTRLTTASYIKIALLLGIGGLLMGSIGFDGMKSCSANATPFGTKVNRGSANIEASNVKNISIKWAAGDVDVSIVDYTKDNTIELVESSLGGFGRAQQMRWNVSGGTLNVDYGDWFSCLMSGSKRLEVRIPQAYADVWEQVCIDGASGNYRIQDIGCDNLTLRLASGQFDTDNVEAKSLFVDVASGKARIAGRFAERVDVQTASGETYIACEQVCPAKIEADVASGLTTVALPENDGFSAKVVKASGEFTSAFPVVQENGVAVYGNGSSQVNVRLASGEFALDKTGR